MPSQHPVFTVSETHGRALKACNQLLAHSQDVGWRSLYAAIMVEAPLDVTEPPVAHPSLIYHLRHPTEVQRKIEGSRRERSIIGPRHLCLTPGETTTWWNHHGHPRILQVYLRQSIYDDAVRQMYGCDPALAPIVPRFDMVDPLLEQLAITIIQALEDGTDADGLYIDTLAQMMAVHIARFHSARSQGPRAARELNVSGERVRSLPEYIEANLDRDLTLKALADEVQLSPLYLVRAFKSEFGQPPHRYVLSRRIERAKELLRNTEMPIVEVALSTGFSSQSHLSNWFQRLVGVSPSSYRRRK